MKDRLITLISALGALALVIALLSPPPAPPGGEQSLPTSTNNGRYGLLGLKRWLDHSAISNMSLRTRYNTLFSSDKISAGGNLLITSAPATVPAREQELSYLQFWLAQGNNVLILTADSDMPPWAFNAARYAQNDLLSQLGFQLLSEAKTEQGEEEKAGGEERGFAETLRDIGQQVDKLNYQATTLTPLANHPLTQNVKAIGARILPIAEPSTRLLGIDWPRNALVLLRDPENNAAFWETRVGDGRIWISRFADLFGNVSLGEKDNAQLLANLIHTALKDGGQVIFDDMHFGVSSLYDPDTFFSDSRLHNTLWFIFAFWLLYVVGFGNRFMPAAAERQKVQAVDFTYAVGGYLARRLTNQGAARTLFQHFFNDIRAHYKKTLNGEPAWELLEQNPRITVQTINRLRLLYNNLNSKRKYNLVKLRNQLLTARKQIII